MKKYIDICIDRTVNGKCIVPLLCFAVLLSLSSMLKAQSGDPNPVPDEDKPAATAPSSTTPMAPASIPATVPGTVSTTSPATTSGFENLPPTTGTGSMPGNIPNPNAMTNQMGLPNPNNIPNQGMNTPSMFKGMPVNPSVLQHMKEDLSFQLKQIQQMLRSLQPQDEQLAVTLKEQQTEILKDLKDINTQLEQSGAPANGEMDPVFKGILEATKNQTTLDPTKSAISPSLTSPIPNSDLANTNALPPGQMIPDATVADTEQKIKKVESAIILLREAGLAQLANHAANQIPNMFNPAFTEEPLNSSLSAPAPGLTDISGSSNPYAPLPSKEVTELKNLINELKSQMTQMANDLTDVQTQIKLLSRQMVQNPAPAAVTAPTSTKTPITNSSVTTPSQKN